MVVGLNKFQSESLDELEPFRVDMAIEKKARKRLEDYKARRDQPAVDTALEDVARACQTLKDGTGDLMPALIDAARAGATNGEMMVPMREAFGWFVSE